jgi:hypothetical protein
MFNHPDDEAAASVIVHGGEQVCLCFNHGTLRNQRWADDTLQREFGYRTVYPTTQSGGLRFEIAVRGA